MVSGVKIGADGDGLGQQYVSPVDAITLRGADIIIVGRGITGSPNPGATAKLYQEAGYSCYEELRNQQKSNR